MRNLRAFSLSVVIGAGALVIISVIGEVSRSDGKAPIAAARKPPRNALLERKAAAALEPDPRAKALQDRPINKRGGESKVTASAQDAQLVADTLCDDCGPGDHWIDDPLCVGGLDRFSTTALIGVDTDLDCLVDTTIALFDTSDVTVIRSDARDVSTNFPAVGSVDGHLDVIDTEIDFMSLTNANASVFLAAGRAATIPLSPSLGTIMEQAGNAALADSFFDVNFEVEFGGQFLYNQEPLRVETVIDCVSPKAFYLHITGCHALYTSPNVGEGVHVANLINAEHETFPDPCPDLGDCCTVHQGSGCIEGSCCQTVCATDPSCCDGTTFAWSQTCAELAWGLCPSTCAPFGSSYSFSPAVRPAGATDCQPVFDAATPGESNDIIIFNNTGDEIRTIINGAVPRVFENKLLSIAGVTTICISMSVFPEPELFPLDVDVIAGDGCLALGADAPLSVPPGQIVIGASLFATDSNGEVALDTLLDPSVCTIVADTMTCNADLPGLAGANVESVSLCVDLIENEPIICEPTADATACEPTLCPNPATNTCVPKCAAAAPNEMDLIISECDCVQGGCSVNLDVGSPNPPFCGGGCPPCESCISSAGGGSGSVCCGCKRIGDLNGDGFVDLRDYRKFQLSFGKTNVAGTKYDCADIDGNGTVSPNDYFILQDHLDGPIPFLEP